MRDFCLGKNGKEKLPAYCNDIGLGFKTTKEATGVPTQKGNVLSLAIFPFKGRTFPVTMMMLQRTIVIQGTISTIFESKTD